MCSFKRGANLNAVELCGLVCQNWELTISLKMGFFWTEIQVEKLATTGVPLRQKHKRIDKWKFLSISAYLTLEYLWLPRFFTFCVTRTPASDYYIRTEYTAKDVLFHSNGFKVPCLKFELFKTLFRNEERKMHWKTHKAFILEFLRKCSCFIINFWLVISS